MGPTWVLSSPGEPHVGPMNLAIWDASRPKLSIRERLYQECQCADDETQLMVDCEGNINEPYLTCSPE